MSDALSRLFYRYTDSDGRTLVIYCDADKLEAHLKEISPQDSATIELLCRMIRQFSKFNMPIEKPSEHYNFLVKGYQFISAFERRRVLDTP